MSLYSGGLAIQRGERTSILPWDEILVVWHKEKRDNLQFEDYLGSILDGIRGVYTLQGPGGELFILDSFLRDVKTLNWHIRWETTSRLLPKFLQAYEVEGHVEFGGLVVDREGLEEGPQDVAVV